MAGAKGVPLFYSYAHGDERYRKKLEAHLSNLRREGLISEWHDRKIQAGSEWREDISERLDEARIILLLVSADFLNSDFCNSVELKRALERHTTGQARVIPVILRPCDWRTARFGKFQALPANGEGVTMWHPQDKAFADIAQGIRDVATELSASGPKAATAKRRSRKMSSNRDDRGAEMSAASRKSATPKRRPRKVNPNHDDSGYVDITIDKDFNTFTKDQQSSFLAGLGSMLQMSKKIRVVSKQPGSVKLRLKLPRGQGERLVLAFKAGQLKAYAVKYVKLTSKGAPFAAPKKAAPKKAVPVKLTEKQAELLKKIMDAGEAGYVAAKAETKGLESLQTKKLIKRGAKHKESGSYHYSVSKAGEKQVNTTDSATPKIYS
jgi:hypothetical protein